MVLFDPLQDPHTPKPGSPDLKSQIPSQPEAEGTPLFKELSCSLDFIAEKVLEGLVAGLPGECLDAVTKALHILQGEIDPIFFEIDRHILPEVGELEGSTDMV
jgi:hypothetical protein